MFVKHRHISTIQCIYTCHSTHNLWTYIYIFAHAVYPTLAYTRFIIRSYTSLNIYIHIHIHIYICVCVSVWACIFVQNMYLPRSMLLKRNAHVLHVFPFASICAVFTPSTSTWTPWYSRWTNYSNPASMSCRLPPVPQISTLWFRIFVPDLRVWCISSIRRSEPTKKTTL